MNRKAHIAILVPAMMGGGTERVTGALSSGLAARGHRVDMVLLNPQRARLDEVAPNVRIVVPCSRKDWESHPIDRASWAGENVSLLHVGRLIMRLTREFRGRPPIMKRGIVRGRRVAHYIERERPDLVLANLPMAETAAFHAARMVNFPTTVVPVFHGLAGVRPGTMARRRVFFRSAPRLISVSNGVADAIARQSDMDRGKFVTIHNGVTIPPEALMSEPDHPWFSDDGPPIVLSAGRMAPEKDFPTLIRAFALAREEHPCRLVILGEGDERPAIERGIKEHDLEDVVSLPGWVTNPWSWMARASLFVLSSKHEGFGLVLIEALAAGCPAVSTDCPSGPREILQDPDLLAPVGDPLALSRVMLRQMRRPRDEEANRKMAKRFSMDRMLDGYEALIAELVA